MAINSLTAITKLLSLTQGYFHFLQGFTPGPHFSPFFTRRCPRPLPGLPAGRSVVFSQSRAPDSRTACPTAAPAPAAHPAGRARVTYRHKAGYRLETMCGCVVGCSRAPPTATGGLAGQREGNGRYRTARYPQSPLSRVPLHAAPGDTEKGGAGEVTLQQQFPNSDGLGQSEGEVRSTWVMERGGKGQENLCQGQM